MPTNRKFFVRTAIFIFLFMIGLMPIGSVFAGPAGQASFDAPFAIHFSPLKLYWEKSDANIRRFPQTAAYIKEMGAQVVRLDLPWEMLEPKKGAYDWSIPDRAVEVFQGSSVALHFRLFTNARWAVKPSSGNMLWKGMPRPNAPRTMGDYEQFLTRIVQRYKGKVKYWQIDNEIFNFGTFWAGTEQDYLSVLRTAYRTIKSVDPAVLVLPSGIAMGTEDIGSMMRSGRQKKLPPRMKRGLQFVSLVLSQGKNSFDIVDLHLYWKYEEIPEKIELIRELMQRHGYEKPIFITETGGPDIRAYLSPREFKQLHDADPGKLRAMAPRLSNPEARKIILDENAQERFEIVAREVIKRYVVSFAAGASSVSWLRLYSFGPTAQDLWWDKLGLMDFTDTKRREGYRAYQVMTRKLRAFQSVEQVALSADAHAYRFSTTSGQVYALWSDKGASAALSVPWNEALVTDAFGRESRVKAHQGRVTLQLTAVPVYCEESRP